MILFGIELAVTEQRFNVFSMTHPSWNRRTFLAGSAALFSQLAPARAAETTPTAAPAPFRNPNVYRFQIGDIEAFSISDGHSLMRSGIGMMHPEGDRPQMKTVMESHYERLDGIPLYINILVLRKGKEVAIFDAGFGKWPNPNFGWFFDALASVGIQRGDVGVDRLRHDVNS